MRNGFGTVIGGGIEKPRSAAMERASAMPPRRFGGFFPIHAGSPPADISAGHRYEKCFDTEKGRKNEDRGERYEGSVKFVGQEKNLICRFLFFIFLLDFELEV